MPRRIGKSRPRQRVRSHACSPAPRTAGVISSGGAAVRTLRQNAARSSADEIKNEAVGVCTRCCAVTRS
eukprot:4365831-Alexandrium_andersonii.AAC.1